ncbi:MAG: glycoside hydrolase family 127 protein [Thermoproteota archaeon]
MLQTLVVNNLKSPYSRLHSVPIECVKLKEGFWARRLEVIRKVTIPSQYLLLEKTGRIDNFRRASGKRKGEFKGLVFNDSDVYKWLEATAFILATGFDEELYSVVQRIVEEISFAQDQDGYLNTFFVFEEKGRRWTNLRDMHELYCAGHLIQAAVALHRAVGDRKLLDVALRFANHIVEVFGIGGRVGVPGHPEIEMALVELYRETGNNAYLELAKSFLDNRGRGIIGGGVYHIDHKPFRELSEIIGHAVRALYLNCGATDIYMETGDMEIWGALERLWKNMAECKMYVTGGVGSRYDGESFGFNYELPNMYAYAETCAAIASFMWNWRMFLASGDAKYVDLMELTLYNGILAGISLNGKEYLYVNPLADRGTHRRQEWFECACCPPNVARLIASLTGYFYSVSEDGIWVNLYDKSVSHIEFRGSTVTIIQDTNYPWDEKVAIRIGLEKELSFNLNLRIPGWSRGAEICVTGSNLQEEFKPGTYFTLHRAWKDGDEIELSLEMPVRKIYCNPHVYENLGKVVLARGPIVYCLEGADNKEFNVWDLSIPTDAEIRAEWIPSLLDGVMVLKGEGYVSNSDWKQDYLYRDLNSNVELRRVDFTAIPYYAWANREPGSMTVWIRLIPKAALNYCQVYG